MQTAPSFHIKVLLEISAQGYPAGNVHVCVLHASVLRSSVFLSGLFPAVALLLTPDVSAMSEHMYYLSSLLSSSPFPSQSGIPVPNRLKSEDMSTAKLGTSKHYTILEESFVPLLA